VPIWLSDVEPASLVPQHDNISEFCKACGADARVEVDLRSLPQHLAAAVIAEGLPGKNASAILTVRIHKAKQGANSMQGLFMPVAMGLPTGLVMPF
jgi:hypothetical protein